MAVANLLLEGNHFEETISVVFNTSQPIKITFTRDGDRASMSIPPSSFTPNQIGLIKSNSLIPNIYVPSIKSTNFIIINGGTYTSSAISIDIDGTITMSYGPTGASFQPLTNYITNSNQTISYLV